MIRLYTNKRIILLLFAGLSTFLTSCYSDNVCLKSEREYSNPKAVSQYGDSTKIAFVSNEKAYLRASGITAFPDGGQSKVIYQKTGLYVFDTKTKNLTFLQDLTNSKNTYRNYNKKTQLLFIDNLVYCNMLPGEDAKDSLELKQADEKCYAINLDTKQTKSVDTAAFYALYKTHREEQNVDLSGLKTIPLSEFGLNIQEIYPKSDKAYIEEIIYYTSDGQTTRRAIFEQIISKLNKSEMDDILKKMEEHKNTLEGYEQFSCELYTEEIRQNIEALSSKK